MSSLRILAEQTLFGIFALSLLLGAPVSSFAEDAVLILSGSILDPNGGTVPNARVLLLDTNRIEVNSANSDGSGQFSLSVTRPGRYDLSVLKDGFAPATIHVRVAARSAAPVAVTLKVADFREQMTVTAESTQVNADAGANLDTVTLDRKLLDNLPVFDQNYVGAITAFLDPGSVGTGGVTLVVDGVEQSSVGVSASAIQQVKINQNPYSAEFSRPGRGRIEIITKPGSTEYHGAFNVLFRDYHFNARDPFAPTRPAEQRRIFEGNLTGPVGQSKTTSFLITANREEEDLQSIVNAFAPAGLVRENVNAPLRNLQLSAGINHSFGERRLISIRGNYADATRVNQNVGGIVLPEAGASTEDREDQLYYNDTFTISPKLLNQFRIVFGRQHTPTVSVNQGPGIVVQDSFIGGGAQADRLQTENHINLNEVVSVSAGRHQIRTGINIPDISRRGLDDLTYARGVYSFSTLRDYFANRPYSLIRQQGDPHVVFVEVVAGAFFQDDFRVNKRFSLSGGVRYDWQNYFHDNNNVSPRLAFAYALGARGGTVLRGGAGLFFDRSGPQPIFDLERYNGIRLRRIVVGDPPYPMDVSAAMFPTSVVRLEKNIQIPYTAQFSFGVEHQLAKELTLSAHYFATRGVSLFRSRDLNAPPPPFYESRPNPGIGVFREIESSGRLQADQLEVGLRGSVGRWFSGLLQYVLGRAYSNVGGDYTRGTRSSGINAFPANDYDLSGEWARADYDQRHRISVLGTSHVARYLDIGVSFSANSGMPYTETTGRDDNRDGLAIDRPAGVRRNTLQGPRYVDLDLRWSHEFLLLRDRKEKSPRLNLSIDAFNVTNTVNYAAYVGNLSSPFFGSAIAALPSRRVQFGLRFSF